MPYTFDQAASTLGVGRNILIKQLRQKGVLDSANIPQGRFSGVGLFVVANGKYKHPNPDKGLVHYQKTLVTDKGLMWIDQLVNSNTNSSQTLH